MRKKLLSLLLVMAMVVSFIPGQARAAEDMTITIDSVTVTAGQQSVEIPVRIANAASVAGMALEFEIPEGLTLTDIVKGDAVPSGPAYTLSADTRYASIDYTENFTCSDGTLLTLKVDVSAAATGPLQIAAHPNKNDEGNICDEEGMPVPVTFVPGTITVKASTTDRTVKFMNGTTEVKTETVVNGGKLSAIPEAPAATDGQSFLGWYAVVDGTDYLLDNIDDKITGTEASTETAIYADTTYQAIWASKDMIAAGYLTTDGKTTISGVSQATDLQGLVTGHNGGTVKLLQDVELGSAFLAVAESTTVTIDLNGTTLSGSGLWDKSTNWLPLGPLVNDGTLFLTSTAETKGTVKLNDNVGLANDDMFAAIINRGSIRMTNVKAVTESNFDNDLREPGCGYYGTNASTSTVIDNCEFQANKNAAFKQFSGVVETISNSTFVGGNYNNGALTFDGDGVTAYGSVVDCVITANETGCAGLKVRCATLENVTNCTITGADGVLVEDYGSVNNQLPAIKNLNSTVQGTDGYAVRTTPKFTQTDYQSRQPSISYTGGQYKGTKGVALYENSAIITYPEGKILLEGEDGWYTLQDGYVVSFLNSNGSILQEVSCAEGKSAVYTAATPTKDADEEYIYTFAGKWNTKADGTGTEYSGNTIPNITSNMTLYAQYDKASAKVVTLRYTENGTEKTANYAGLKAAAEAVNSGSYTDAVITLNEDAEEISTVEVKKNVTIDLNGHKLSINNDDDGIKIPSLAAYFSAVTLTIKDSAGNGRYEHTSGVAGKYAIMNVKSMQNAQTVVIKSGTIEEKGAGCSAICAGDPGGYAHVDIQGGTIIGAENGLVAKGGSFTISRRHHPGWYQRYLRQRCRQQQQALQHLRRQDHCQWRGGLRPGAG